MKSDKNKPALLQDLKLYGSSYIHMENKLSILLPVLWTLPYRTRRVIFKKIFKKEYWRILSARHELEISFTHHENKHLTYSINAFHEKKCIFVHIPKCGGISLAQSLLGHCVPHSTITDYQIMFDSSTFNNYFKFTFTRNPWDRLVSAYFFLKEGGFDSKDKALLTPFIEQHPTFSNFVEFLYYHREYLQLTHFAPQSKWIKTPSGKIPFDYIGRLESLDDSVSEIRTNLGIEYDIKPKKLNISTRNSDFRGYYTKKTRTMVDELYREDIKLLGYQFDA
ncbi:MAG: sulfotransferase family 2 domain-containing protein [Candidatus Reddybacter sp.]